MVRQIDARRRPHVFEEVDLLAMAKPGGHPVMGPYAPPPTPSGKSVICGICKKPRTDRVHIEGEARANSESPRWGL